MKKERYLALNTAGAEPVAAMPANCRLDVHNKVMSMPVAHTAPEAHIHTPKVLPPMMRATSTNAPSVHRAASGITAKPMRVGKKQLDSEVHTAMHNARGYVTPGLGTSAAHVPAPSKPATRNGAGANCAA